VYRPDLIYYGPGRLSGSPATLDTSPDLIIEIFSPGSEPLDLITKRGDYERFGVGVYWVVDPASGNVRCWQRQNEKFVEVAPQDDRLSSSAVPGFALDLIPIRQAAFSLGF
jgi:Uma2 family endonuclease